MADPIWVVDTSAVIEIKSKIPREARPAVFDGLTALAAAGRLLFPSQVIRELKRDSGTHQPDAACQWALSVESSACSVAWSTLYSTVSRPFAAPDTGKIAVKVINHYGDEVLKVYDVVPVPA